MHGYFKGNKLIPYSKPQRPEGDRIFRRDVRPSTRPNTGATNDVMDTEDHTSPKRVNITNSNTAESKHIIMTISNYSHGILKD